MNVLIVGGGVAGCACAGLLRKYDIAEVTLVEQAPAFANIGYVMGLWSTGRAVLHELGLDEQVAEHGTTYEADTVYDKYGRLIKTVRFADFPIFASTIGVKRADLHRCLYENLQGVDLRLNTTFTNLEQAEEGVIVTFSDGSCQTFDLVIGADGIGSAVRETVFGTEFRKPYGWRVWMWWLPTEYGVSNTITSHYGGGRLCATMPFYDTPVAIALATVPPSSEKALYKPAQLPTLFADFDESTKQLIETAVDADRVYCDDVSYVTMSQWYQGRVVLVGDAQHAASPVTGMGASMALEDVSVLVQELRAAPTIDQALTRFAVRREPRIKKFRTMVERMDRWAMADGLFGYLRNRAVSIIPTTYFVRMLRSFLDTNI